MSELPPPPSYPPAKPEPPSGPPGYVPFQQFYQPPTAPPPTRRRSGPLGWLAALLAAVWAYAKYALVIFKLGAIGAVLKTAITLVLSLGVYALFFGPIFAVGLVVMILIHEMGHVFEIRRLGMKASAPLFIPFFGAAIFQRQHPTDALKQAQIGIAGPIAGTVGAVAAFVLYRATGWQPLLGWAYLGFFLNLFNLIPLGMLDGGWVLAVVSKWFQVVGLVAMGAAVLLLHLFSPILIFILVLAIPAAIARFRNDKLPYYQSVPMSARLGMGAAWLALVAFLGLAMVESQSLLRLIVG